MTQPPFPKNQHVIEHMELVAGNVLSAADVARICNVTIEWVHTHIDNQILEGQHHQGIWYLSCTTLWRAREIASLEHQYEADPELAALVVDCLAELRQLRQRLAFYEAAPFQDGC